jgi:putative phosphoesterase
MVGDRRMSGRHCILGIISDTHGVLRPEACDALRGAHQIIHAGDVGRPEVLDRLRALAPTSVVRGNVDAGDWATDLPYTMTLRVGALRLFLIHDIGQLAIDPVAEGFAAVVYGHSHVPSVEDRHGVVFINPGSAGPRRFKLPVTVARAEVTGHSFTARILELSV